MNLKRRKAFYGDWWDEAAKWRTGGFDRLCGGVPGSPSTEEIEAAGIKGTLFVNEILTVRPGSALDFLAAVVEQRKPLMARVRPPRDRALRGDEQPARGGDGVGHRHPVERALPPEPRHDPGSVRRRRAPTTASSRGSGRRREFVTGGDTHIMTPLPRTVYGPDDWEDATLDEWLQGNAAPDLDA